MDEVIVVHLLRVDDVTVLLLAQVLRVDAVGSQELLVGHAERLADGLGDQLRLTGGWRKRVAKKRVIAGKRRWNHEDKCSSACFHRAKFGRDTRFPLVRRQFSVNTL